MAIKTKSRAAADAAAVLRNEAAELRAQLMDVSVTLSADEVRKIEESSKALEMRAAAVANFTPDEEIEDQGGLGTPTTRSAPHTGSAPEEATYETQVRTLRENVREAFGGPNALILAVARASVKPLTARQAQVLGALEEFTTRTITAGSGDASGAEFLLPLQQVESIFQVPVEVGGLFATARRFSVRGRTLRIPYLVQTDATGSSRPMAGIAAVTIVGEAALKPEFEPKFLQRLLTVYKYAGYTELGDETLADDMTGDLAPAVQSVIGGQIVNTVNEHITADGTGVAMPLGAFHENNPSLHRVERTTAGQFRLADVFNMYARHVMGAASTWFLHPSVIPQLMNLSLSGTTLVTFVTNLQGRPQMQLLGMPVVVTPLMRVLGLEGDVALGNGEFYAMALRQALTIESSIHFRFRNDITAYRFFMRAGGIPIPDGTYSYKSAASVKEYVVSPFVVLDDIVAA